MRKLRVLVVTDDRIMGSAFRDIVELEKHHALWVTGEEEWCIACEVYKPDLIMSYDNAFFRNRDMIDCFCGRVPIILTAWGNPDPFTMHAYTGYDITYMKAPCDTDEIIHALYKATGTIQRDLHWLDTGS